MYKGKYLIKKEIYLIKISQNSFKKNLISFYNFSNQIRKLKFCYGNRDGIGARWSRRIGSSSPSRMVLFYLIPTPPRMMGKTFSSHPRPLGPRQLHPTSPYLVKFYFLLICPTTNTIFLMKLISLIKIYLKITTKFFSSNQINF